MRTARPCSRHGPGGVGRYKTGGSVRMCAVSTLCGAPLRAGDSAMPGLGSLSLGCMYHHQYCWLSAGSWMRGVGGCTPAQKRIPLLCVLCGSASVIVVHSSCACGRESGQTKRTPAGRARRAGEIRGGSHWRSRRRGARNANTYICYCIRRTARAPDLEGAAVHHD